ncbi:MAG: DUF6768 family protein [Vitreimonas sp.]
MSDLDKAIREGYSAEDAALMQRLASDPTMTRQVLDAFQGPFGGLNILSVVFTLAMLGAGGYCVWRFLDAADVRDMLIWGGGAAIALCGIAMVKLWFWMELQRNATVREIKRLELQVSRLASRLAS